MEPLTSKVTDHRVVVRIDVSNKPPSEVLKIIEAWRKKLKSFKTVSFEITAAVALALALFVSCAPSPTFTPHVDPVADHGSMGDNGTLNSGILSFEKGYRVVDDSFFAWWCDLVKRYGKDMSPPIKDPLDLNWAGTPTGRETTGQFKGRRTLSTKALSLMFEMKSMAERDALYPKTTLQKLGSKIGL